jgi:TonB family protein
MNLHLQRIALVSTLAFISPVFAAEKSKPAADNSTAAVGATKSTTPIPRFQARPQYPSDMREKGIPAEVVVDFIVNEKGDVENARAIRSNHQAFEAPAVQAVAKWKFKPATKDGKAVATHMQVPLIFGPDQKE